jgi:hypothetical protein
VQEDEHHDLGEAHPQAGSPACSEHQEAVRRLRILPLFSPMRTRVNLPKLNWLYLVAFFSSS